ncbi:MAG TPA: pectin acetylesterase-family hydrolase [Candidatus Limnocylindria bacterium]|nr:pectin acetylesterase-family hydrolase [Candidatus Limnocylindria bacterium]
MRTRSLVSASLALAAVVAAGTPAAAKKPKPYPTIACVSAKQTALATYCKKALGAWAAWEKSQNDAKRAASLASAAGALEAAWAKAESKAAHAGVDCSETTASTSALGAFLDSAMEALVDDVNMGLDLGDNEQASCGQKILKAAGGACSQLLAAESKYVKNPGKKNAGSKREAAQEKAVNKLVSKVEGILAKGCPSSITADGVAGSVGAIAERLTHDTINSPSVPADAFATIAPEGPVEYLGRTFTAVCMDGSPYAYFAKRGTVNKLLIYYQGGGACWEQLTCSVPVCDSNVGPGDNPDDADSGFADLTNPANPFRDWNVVFVSYCSCDIHFGDAAQDYANVNPTQPRHVEHRGYQNSRIVEKWAREHFVAPDEVFVTGSSAGAYGAWFNAPLHHEVWPGARFFVLADAGNGVVTQEFLETYFPNWNFEGNLPPEFPELKEVLDQGLGIPGYTEVVAGEFPQTLWAHYTTAFDGSFGGQTGFYNVMLNHNDPVAALSWWEGSCAWNEAMRQQAIDTAAAVPTNYRYYIGAGSRHTAWGSNKVYTDTTGGVPPLVDWIEAMLASTATAPDPGWTNVECTNCGLLLPGDPRPNPLEPPFEQVGEDVIIMCAASPAGAFVDAPAVECRS